MKDNSLNESMESNLPLNATINSVYPNPFNPTSTIQYMLVENSIIELSICNIYGEKIQTLFNGYKDKGNHEVIWNGENFPSGMYFFTLYTPDAIHTHKLALLK